MDTMRAGRFVGQGKMVCEEAAIAPPQDGDLLVRTAYASICGTDLHTVCLGMSAHRPPAPPGYPGHEGVGEVVESKDTAFAAGTQVLTVPNAFDGRCFAEYQTIPARACVPLPESDLPLSHLLMAQQLGTVIFALRRHPIDVEGKTVVILGQGSAGAFFTFLLRRAGAATVITSDLSGARRTFSKALGADIVLDPEVDDVRQAVLDSTGGMGADYLVEAVGSKETLLQTVDLVRPDAELMWFGLPDSREPVPISFNRFFGKRLTAYSIFGAQGEEGLVSFREALDLINHKEIDVGPLLSHVLPIEEVDTAFAIANERTDNALKVSLSFGAA